MKINKNNYESFFIDYLEGNLDEKLVNDFIEFLQQNNDLKEELSLFDTVPIAPESISFSKKEKLYKEKYDLEATFNEAAISILEGDISDVEKTAFIKYMGKNPEKQKEINLLEKTKIHPDENIIFNKKKQTLSSFFGKIGFSLVSENCSCFYSGSFFLYFN